MPPPPLSPPSSETKSDWMRERVSEVPVKIRVLLAGVHLTFLTVWRKSGSASPAFLRLIAMSWSVFSSSSPLRFFGL
jgi:hypothetical protein